MKKVLYAGSFDPITKGHQDVIKKASMFFDEVVIAILNNPSKRNYLFSPKERYEIIKKLYENNSNIKVLVSDKTAVDIALENNCVGLVRGLRTITDYEEETKLNFWNNEISSGKINTVFLFADLKDGFLSSSAVKEVYALGKDISKYVDDEVYKKIMEKKKVKTV